MRRLVARFGIAVLLLVPLIGTSSGPAQAATQFCNVEGAVSVPGTTVQFRNCRVMQANGSWRWVMYLANSGKAPYVLDIQRNLRIDGVDHGLGNWSIGISGFDSNPGLGFIQVDPYHEVGEVEIWNRCTKGHVYAPFVKVRQGSPVGAWSPAVNATSFTCTA